MTPETLGKGLAVGLVATVAAAVIGLSAWYEYEFPCIRSESYWSTDTTCRTTNGTTTCTSTPIRRTVCLERTTRQDW